MMYVTTPAQVHTCSISSFLLFVDCIYCIPFFVYQTTTPKQTFAMLQMQSTVPIKAFLVKL